jgi:hypothetical protein
MLIHFSGTKLGSVTCTQDIDDNDFSQIVCNPVPVILEDHDHLARAIVIVHNTSYVIPTEHNAALSAMHGKH